MAQKNSDPIVELPAAQALIEAVGIEQLADVLKAAGYRVSMAEQGGTVQLMSASQGMGFAVRFGNAATQSGSPATGVPVRYLDYTFSCLLQVQGDLPEELVAGWNRSKRFARLASHGPFLALEMDIVVAGVSERYLRATIELWDRLLQEFLLHLRNRPAMAATAAEGAAMAAAQAGHAKAVGQ